MTNYINGTMANQNNKSRGFICTEKVSKAIPTRITLDRPLYKSTGSRNLNNLICVNLNKHPTPRKIVPKCLIINARSLAKPDAAAALHSELSTNNIDICFVSETWLNPNIPTHLVCPQGYVMVRKDRPDSHAGGGVAILCRNDWKITVFNNNMPFETIQCKIITSNLVCVYYAMCIYHPPDPIYDSELLLDSISNFCETTQTADPNAKLIIAGDINQLNIHDLLCQHTLNQMVKSATRGNHILDVFITSSPFLWKTPKMHKGLVRSDHLAIIVTPIVPEKPTRKTVYFRDTREHRKLTMERMMSSYDWTSLDAYLDNPSDAVTHLNNAIWSMYDISFPLIKVKMSSRDPPYMSPLVKHLCNIRNKNLYKYDTGLQEKINTLIRENQVNAVSKENQKHRTGTKGWWDTTNKITGRKSQSTQVSSVVSPVDINAFFQSINTDEAYVEPERLVIPEGTRVPSLHENEVLHLLSHLKKTSAGPDNLPYWLWRDFSHHLAPIITKIFNKSIYMQKVPDLWKLANVSPIPKESPLESCDQLRPISLTNIIMRLFERLIYSKELLTILKTSIHPDQFAYKSGHNTTMAMIKIQHNWLKSLDGDADFVRVFTFDFSKAFDSVPHHIVCKKLQSLQINPYVINWIICFLSGRQQRVVVDGITTDFVDINRGVPQGTVLGPVLFTIMVNDITPVDQASFMIKYADDITLSIAVKEKSQDPSEREVLNIQHWATENRMKLNIKKTWEMIVKGKTTKPPPGQVQSIERKSELKILGVTFHENPLNWNTQFETMLRKAASRVYILRVCKYYGYSPKELSRLFNCLITPIFLYGVEVWGTAGREYINRINKFMKRAFRNGYVDEYTPFEHIIKQRDHLLFNNIINNSEHCLYDLLPPKRKRMLRNRKHNFTLPSIRTERFKQSFINRCLFI